MALPKIEHPIYELTLPSNKEVIHFKPFTVREEKILLMARASEKTEDIISSIKQIVRNCVIEPINIDKLATFDIEYIFVKLRAKSVNEFVDLEFTDPDTEAKINFKVNLDDVAVKFNPEHTNRIEVFENIYFQMKYPTLDDTKLLENGIDENNILDILYACVDKIYDNEEVYTDYSEEEFKDFIDNLPCDSLNDLIVFFDTMPSLEHTVTLKNNKGDTKEILLKGINSFFTF